MKLNTIRHAGLAATCAALTLGACVPGALNVNVPSLGGATASPGASGTGTPGATPSPGANATAKPTASPQAGGTPKPTTGTPKPTATGTPKPAGTAAPAAANATDEVEPNDDFPTADEVAIGDVVSGTAGGDDETGDYFRVTIPSGGPTGWLTVTLSEAGGDWIPMITFYKQDKSWLHEKGAPAGETEQIVAAMPVKPDRTYYVKLSPHADDESVPYKLRFEFDPVEDTFEPNDDFTQAVDVESGQKLVFATLEPADGPADQDFFQIEAPQEGQSLRIQLKNNTTSDDGGTYTVTVYDSKKQFVGEAVTNGPQADVDEAIALPAAGTYFVKVTGTSTDALSELTLTVQ